ncbi:MAG: GumC family protein [Micavibrio sp.]
MDIENSLRGFLTAFFRQSGAFLSISVIVFLAGAGYLLMTKPVYEASGSVVVKFGQDARPEANIGEQADYAESDTNARQEIIRSYIKIISSPDMLRGLVKEFGALRLYPDLEGKLEADAVEEVAVRNLLEGDLKVTYDQTHVIDIAVRNQDPKIAMEIATRVMQAFVRRRTEIYNTPQTDFLRQQIEEARQKLQGAQHDLQAFKQKAGISAIDEELAQLLREKSELSTLAFSAVTVAQARLVELETQEAKMKSTYRMDSPMLNGFRKTVAVARADLKQRQDDLNASGKSGSSLGTRMANVDKRLSYLEAQRGGYNDLQQQVKIDEENYLYYLKRGEEARINKMLNSQNITRIGVVDKPVVPVEPIKPKKKIFLAVTLLAAMIAGAGTALSRELLDDRLTSPDQVYSRLGVPVLLTFDAGD